MSADAEMRLREWASKGIARDVYKGNRRMSDDLDEAADTIAALRKDAERYRWLRYRVGAVGNHGFVANFPPLPDGWRHGSIAEHLDAAIDAAQSTEGER